jgi:spermidine synthase
MPAVALAGTLLGSDLAPPWASPFIFVISAILFGLVGNVLRKSFAKLAPKLESHADQYGAFLNGIEPRLLLPAIFLSACASLFLEMIFIRWQSSFFEFFAFYKNFSLLACFAGLGTGYAISSKRSFPVTLSILLSAFLIGFFSFMKYVVPPVWTLSLRYLPFTEQAAMGMMNSTTVGHYVAIYSFLAVTFVLSAITFVPVGQLCGTLMNRIDPLKAYSANLLGSLAGILILLLASFLWTPPVIWFALAFALVIPFLAYTTRSLIAGSLAALFAVALLAWPAPFPHERIYSPYQLIEQVPTKSGLPELIASGHYYQRILDLSPQMQSAKPDLKNSASYYGIPYAFKPHPDNVLIVGAGSGNDVAAALRAGAKHVDAVEIDPAIYAFGAHYHPEHPYDDPRVRVIINDARAFFNATKDKYDVVVFALLDSHTLTSSSSSLRLDSYVYTSESIKKARALLKDGGILSLSFTFCGPALTKKIQHMVTEAFGGKPPACVYTKYDASMCFLQSHDGSLTIAPEFIARTGFENADQFLEKLGNVKTDLPTDDWPFFYMPRKVFPFSYLPMILLTVILSGLLLQSLNPQAPRRHDLPFFFLGAGFMLIETKAITELGLHFGNTWLVTGIVVSAVLIMAFVANLIVSILKPRLILIAYLLLLGSIVAGAFYSRDLASLSGAAELVVPVVVLTCPLLFSGIVFSTLLKDCGNVGAAMSLNLFGAMLGGVLEYNAMWLGYRNLYFIALGLYLCALLFSVKKGGGTQAATESAPAQPDA